MEQATITDQKPMYPARPEGQHVSIAQRSAGAENLCCPAVFGTNARLVLRLPKETVEVTARKV